MSKAEAALLVVDDIEDNRYALTRRLAREGYANVAIAVDGKQALELLDAKPFDLVLLDINMPNLNGYEVLERMKADGKLRHIPVIMISAVDEIESVVRCIELGAEDYLPKPFNPILLRARVGASLERKRLHDQVAAQAADLAAWNRDAGAAGAAAARRDRAHEPAEAIPVAAGRRAGRRRQATSGRWRATAAPSPCCSATCAALRRSPRPPSPRR